MKIHEYQAKELFRKFAIPVPRGGVAFSIREAETIANELGGYPVAVKAQIHAGGRGKGGGVKLAASPLELTRLSAEILGMTLVTQQTGPDGKKVNKVLIEEGLEIKKEYYLSLLVDRETASIVVMASREGGMNIEEVAAKNPEKIVKVSINPLLGIQGYHLRQVGFALAIPPPAMKEFCGLLAKLYEFFTRTDCTLVEINPLILTSSDRIIALDAKVDLDSNALYRHPELAALRDRDEEDPLEVEASEFNLNYINLDGNVGNIVNGAGLAMATMDIIKNAGAEPANFMDVGGGATAEMVENALRIILKDPKVQVVLINIFGGILRCDVFAEGVVEAARKSGIAIPLVVRMAGTNVAQGKKILLDSGLNLINAEDLHDAAQKVALALKTRGES